MNRELFLREIEEASKLEGEIGKKFNLENSWRLDFYNNFFMNMPTSDEDSNKHKESTRKPFKDICFVFNKNRIYGEVVKIQDEIDEIYQNPLFRDVFDSSPKREILSKRRLSKLIGLYTLTEPSYVDLRVMNWKHEDLTA